MYHRTWEVEPLVKATPCSGKDPEVGLEEQSHGPRSSGSLFSGSLWYKQDEQKRTGGCFQNIKLLTANQGT